MKNTKKKLKGQSSVVKYSFSGKNITKYSGIEIEGHPLKDLINNPVRDLPDIGAIEYD